MSNDTYQLLYCSRNCIHGTGIETAAEIGKILDVSRINNVRPPDLVEIKMNRV
jgi:hypothetical protein